MERTFLKLWGVLQVVIVAVMVLAVLSGCCKLTDANGVTTTSCLNCITTAENYACNPPAAVMNTIKAASGVIADIINLAAPGTAAFINATTAAGAIATLQQTGCVTLTSLDSLVTYLQTVTNPAKAATIGVKMKVVSPVDLGPLVDYANAQHYFKKF